MNNFNGINSYPNPYLTNPYQRNNSNSITWVQGIEGAKAYQLMPNSNVVLMDSESEKFYIKSADNVGMCNLRSFIYQEELEKPKVEYVTKQELEEVVGKYEQLIQRLDAKSIPKQSASTANNETGKR